MAVIRLRDITKLDRVGMEQIRALDGVDLEVGQNEYVAVMGTSGSGKSTLMNILGCLDRPSGGTYELDGRPFGQLRRLRTFRFGHWSFQHSSGHRDDSIGRVEQTGTALRFQKCRVREKFPIQTHVGISPCSGRGAMENMQLIGAVDLGLRLVVRDDPA